MKDFEDQLEKNSANTVTGFLLHWANRAQSLVADRVNDSKALKSYIKRYSERHGEIKVLRMLDPIRLGEIYVRLHAIRGTHLRSFSSIEAMEKAFLANSDHSLSLQTEIPQDGIGIANTTARLCILGSPGSGKSTFLKRVGYEALLPRPEWAKKSATNKSDTRLSEYAFENFPLFCELRRVDFTQSDPLIAHLKSDLEVFGFSQSGRFLENGLQNGDFLLLIDGLDEVSEEDMAKAVRSIQSLVHKYPENRFIISCRTAFYKDHLPEFSDFLLCEFTTPQIIEFIQNWSVHGNGLPADMREQLSKSLQSPEHKGTLELVRTPLLLTFVCIVYSFTGYLPPNRGQLYRRAFEILLYEWAASKQVHREGAFREFSPEIEISLLTEIAVHYYLKEQFFFHKSEIVSLIDGFFQKLASKPQIISPSKTLEAIEIHQGLLTERSIGVYSFSHLTIHEYLAAEFYQHNRSRIHKDLPDKFFSERWREIFLILCGLIQDVDVFQAMCVALGNSLDARSRIFFKQIERVTFQEMGTASDALLRRIFSISAYISEAIIVSIEATVKEEVSTDNLKNFSAQVIDDIVARVGFKSTFPTIKEQLEDLDAAENSDLVQDHQRQILDDGFKWILSKIEKAKSNEELRQASLQAEFGLPFDDNYLALLNNAEQEATEARKRFDKPRLQTEGWIPWLRIIAKLRDLFREVAKDSGNAGRREQTAIDDLYYIALHSVSNKNLDSIYHKRKLNDIWVTFKLFGNCDRLRPSLNQSEEDGAILSIFDQEKEIAACSVRMLEKYMMGVRFVYECRAASLNTRKDQWGIIENQIFSISSVH